MLITQGSEDRALLLAPSRTARTFLLGFNQVVIFPPGVDVYDCNTQIQKRGYSSRLAGVSFRVSPKLKTGFFYLYKRINAGVAKR